jgi:PTH2 family peptidyl-tRNA hydrolase
MSELKVKQVIVMRKDLNMRKGKMIAQGAHASLGAVIHIRKALDDSPGHKWGAAFREWFEGTFSKICVYVESEKELMQIFAEAEKANLPVKLITDAGHTEFHGVPTRTCLAIGPCWTEDVDKVTGNLKLL